MSRFPILLLIFICISSQTFPADWSTGYERSGKKETPRYKETLEYFRLLEKNSQQVHLISFGKSAQDRELPLVIVDRDGLVEPDAIRNRGRMILLIQACIHPGEPEGKDAGMMFVRDLVIHKEFPGLLDRVSLLFIPIFNVDGHERFGKYNRINQNGPVETGWRTTANNLNLNRDFLKGDAPEMQAWLRMFSHWMPEFFIDTHTTDGADYQYVLTYQMETLGDMDAGLTDWAVQKFLKPWSVNIENAGFHVFPYVEFRNWHDPKSGLETGVSPPMLSQGYTSLRNRPGLLIETHMLKPYEQRVSATYEAIRSAMEILTAEAGNLSFLERQADQASASPEFRSMEFPLRFETTSDSIPVEFLGVEYHKEKSEITGIDYYVYGTTKTVFHPSYFDRARPIITVKLPEAYLIPPEWSQVIDRIRNHGFRIVYLKKDTLIPVEGWRINNPRWQQKPYEGRHLLVSMDPADINGFRKFPAGSALIDMAQPEARILAHLLEPKGNGSLLSWGFFDAIFEQKEYAENYVMEPVARKMVEEDPVLQSEFEKKKLSDSVFARDPDAILNWFYNRSPYGDPAIGLYPVGKIMERSRVDELIRLNKE